MYRMWSCGLMSVKLALREAVDRPQVTRPAKCQRDQLPPRPICVRRGLPTCGTHYLAELSQSKKGMRSANILITWGIRLPRICGEVCFNNCEHHQMDKKNKCFLKSKLSC
jgi:hypothetical protein